MILMFYIQSLNNCSSKNESINIHYPFWIRSIRCFNCEDFKAQSGKRMKLLIAFSGAYLFAITVLHLIPEIYHTNTDGTYIGLFILIGFSYRLFWTFLSRY